MLLPFPTDPATPSLPNPYFNDNSFVRGDQQRSNNNQIWTDMLALADAVTVNEDDIDAIEADITAINAALALRASPAVLRGSLLAGMGLANNGGDPDNSIDVAAGVCTDSTYTYFLAGSAMTKDLASAWAAGSGNGGRFPGSISNGTWHFFAIRKNSDGSVDYGFDTSVTAANIPSGYTAYRRLGSFVRASGAILQFIQNGDDFTLVTPVLDVSEASPATSAQTRVLASLPTDIEVDAKINVMSDGAGLNQSEVYVSSLAQANLAPSTTVAPLAQLGVGGGQRAYAALIVRTDTAASIRTRNIASVQLFAIASTGWIDSRGKYL